ncbi:MAG: aminoacyl-tRNA hydrolase [Bacteroidota bacterium]|nr:aminoacyl-tRNA hydrolase [Bacteroidota bacterium]
MRFLIAGLGNIGDEYKNTRHNIGFTILDNIAEKENFVFEHARLAFIAKHKIKNRVFFYIKPTTFMNLSGKSIRYWLNYLKIPIENLIVIVDDIAIPFGKIRIRTKGGAGGHNGLEDIINVLGGQNFSRLRFGIGDEFSKGKQVKYVLGEWTDKEISILSDKSTIVYDSIKSIAFEGIAKAMTNYNKK